MYDKTDFERVVDAVSILKEVQQRIGTMKRIGTNHTACCPFHSEKTASFYVSESKSIYKCFGCGESGDVISFVAKYDNLSQIEAMKKLASEYDIKVSNYEVPEDVESIYNVLKIASIQFQSELLRMRHVKRYIVNRGISDIVTLKHWNIGYASEDYTLTADTETLKDAGLLSEKGYNVFRDRLVFPIEDVTGRIIGFTCRDLTGNSKQKYLNTKETKVFDKKKVLYGLRQSIKSIRESNCVILVEGPFDVINLHNLGFTEAVGTLGTSFSSDHAKILRKYTDCAIIMFDGDGAGVKASIRAIKCLVEEGFKKVEVSILPSGKDPGDIKSISEVKESIDWIEYLYSTMEDDEEKKIFQILDIISLNKSLIKRDLMIRNFAEISGLSQYSLTEELNNILTNSIK